MSNHTPGPWVVVCTDENHGHIFIDQDCDRGRPDLARISPMNGAGLETNRANARLIAAAPDLLEALVQAVEQLEADYVPTPLDGTAALIRKLRAAITKAEGRTS